MKCFELRINDKNYINKHKDYVIPQMTIDKLSQQLIQRS